MKIRIKLLSDLCTCSGETYNSIVDMDVVYENEATKELRFGCYVNRYNEITPLVKLLEQTGRVTVTVEGKTIKIFTNH